MKKAGLIETDHQKCIKGLTKERPSSYVAEKKTKDE